MGETSSIGVWAGLEVGGGAGGAPHMVTCLKSSLVVLGWRPIRSLVIHWKYGDFMLKKLTKHGNSLALIIDRPILDLLQIDPETPLEVSTDGKRLIVSPVEGSARRKKFDAAQEWAHKRYGKAFQKLAE